MAWIEQPNRRTQKAKHYQDDQNPNKWRAVVGVADLHYFTGLAWEDVDPSIADDTSVPGFDKSGNKQRHVFRCASGGNYRWYPRRLITTEYVEITGIQYWRTQGGGSWRTLNLPAAVWKSDGAEWDMANMYAAITNTWRRIKTDFILKDSTAYTRLRFAVNLVGLALDMQTWHLTSTTDQVDVGIIDPPTAQDASGADVPITSSYDGTYIEWSVDSTGATYPITIDPTFTDGPSGDTETAKDTTVIPTSSASKNFGTSIYSPGDGSNNKALWGFDLSSIDAAATCNSATLYGYHYGSFAAAAWTMTIYSIASGNSAWPEGVQNNATGGTGDCCWNYLDQDASPTSWAGSAGLATSGTDYEASSLGTFSGNRSDAVGTEYTASLTASRIEAWFGASNTNYGLLIVPSASTGGLCSSDHATTGYHPKLVVDYTVGGGGNLAGSFAGSASLNGTLQGAGALAGSAAGQAAFSGSLLGVGVLAGLFAGASSLVGDLQGAGALAGQVTGSTTLAGTLTGAGTLAGSFDGSTTLAGALLGAGALVGAFTGSTTLTGTLTGSSPGEMQGSFAGMAAFSGSLLGGGALVGSFAGITTLAAALLGSGALSGSFAGMAAFSGTLVDRPYVTPAIVLDLYKRSTIAKVSARDVTQDLNQRSTLMQLARRPGIIQDLYLREDQ